MFQTAKREAGRADLSGVYRLVYVSVASALFKPDDLQKIGKAATLQNAKLDITGILVMDDGRILQILEGEQKSVSNLFAKISKDPRHENVQLVAGSLQDSRYLSCWSAIGGRGASAPEGLAGDFKKLYDRLRSRDVLEDVTPDEVDLLKVMALFGSLPF